MLFELRSRPRPSVTTVDAVDALLECHGRIRHFSGLALRLAASDRSLAEDNRAAAAAIKRYFAEALPLHARDEDESIAPRLAAREPALVAVLEGLTADHRRHDRTTEQLIGVAGAIELEPHCLAARAAELSDVAGGLHEDLLRHLDLEEELVFPAMRRVLAAHELETIREEMRARRA
jgi:iron-sulfur cluster repair protein YtfE (RIC family)